MSLEVQENLLSTPQAKAVEEVMGGVMVLSLDQGREGVRAQLGEGLRMLLESGQNRRVQSLLYRVDVDEQRVLALQRACLPQDIWRGLADLVLARLEEIARCSRQLRYPVDPDDAW